MNILALADRPPRTPIKEILSKHEIDVVCTLGDLDLYEIQQLESVQLPKFGVYGNHCSGNYLDQLGIINLHLKVYSFGGLLWGGFEGSVRYKDDQYAKMYSQEEAISLLENFPYVDVLLTHSPPFGINDASDTAHQGFHALKSYIDTKKPKYLLHGHTYPTVENLITKYQETEIIYVSADKIVSIDSSHSKA
jgi:Icc-related predicted phosphoesterase